MDSSSVTACVAFSAILALFVLAAVLTRHKPRYAALIFIGTAALMAVVAMFAIPLINPGATVDWIPAEVIGLVAGGLVLASAAYVIRRWRSR